MKRLRKYRKRCYGNKSQPVCEDIREDDSAYRTVEYKERYSSRLEKICSIIDEFLENDKTEYYFDGSWRFDIIFEKKINSTNIQRCTIIIYPNRIRILNCDNNMDEEFEIYNDFLFEKYYSIVENKLISKNLGKCDNIINSLLSLTSIKRKSIIDKLFDEE